MASANWSSLSVQPPDPIFHIASKANMAPNPKANLIIGAYRDTEGKPAPLKVVRQAEHLMLDMGYNYEYLPILGFQPFLDAAVKLALADSVPRDNLFVAQTLSGTGALSIGARLLARVYDPTTTAVYLSNPTWPNHYPIFEAAGWTEIKTYAYFDAKTTGLDFVGMKEDIQNAPEGSIFVLHQCAHNPTGVDPTHEQWDEIANLMLAKKHQVFFDSAYQGYATGSLDDDAFAARHFARKGVQFLLAQSFAKNMGLYSERVGTLTVVVKDKDLIPAIKSNVEFIVRSMISTPPAHGARVAHLVLTDPTLRPAWEAELANMAKRIKEMRKEVYDELVHLGTPGSWKHILEQIGMFSFLGLTKEQCQYCLDHNVFITLNGRANMAGLTKETALMLARTIDAAVRHR